jgi:hypothetical protein
MSAIFLLFIYNYYLIIGHYFSGHGKYYVNAIASGIGLLITFASVVSKTVAHVQELCSLSAARFVGQF